MSEVTILYVTVPEHKLAESIGRTLVEKKLAACVNILGTIDSIYRWEGAITTDKEVAFLIKTTTLQVDAVTQHIIALHPYDCPAILSIPVTGGFAPFLSWIQQETSL